MKMTSIWIFVLAAATAGCATPGGRALPVCDGQHLRPANLHGSVLDDPAPVGQATTPAAPTDAAHHLGCGQ